MAYCPAFDPLAPYVTGLTAFVDCRARALGEEGYRALGVGSPVGLALTGLLTIYIALIGYRMLLGDLPSLREGVVAVVKIGFVLALSSQWPAYQALAYDVVVAGPGEIAVRVLEPGGLGGGDAGALTSRVQGAYAAIEEAARPDPAEPPPEAPPAPGPNGQPTAPDPRAAAATEPAVDPTLERAGQVLLVASLAAMLSVRVAAGAMLALGPIFIACFLFGALRGLFEGWVRVLAGAALGAIGVAAVLALELAIVEPQVAALLNAREAEEAVPLLAGELLASTALFALVLLALLIATARTAAGFRLPDALRRETQRLIERIERSGGAAPVPVAALARVAAEERPRARALADAIDLQQRREQRTGGGDTGGVSAPDRRVAALAGATGELRRDTRVPIGQTYRRTATARRSTSASRRDAG